MPDVAILDVKLDKGDNDGIKLLSHIKSINKDVPVNCNYRSCKILRWLLVH
jgi:Response regulator containing CheY-like receiver, AAA-type ATPase, and DNA-binding domains